MQGVRHASTRVSVQGEGSAASGRRQQTAPLVVAHRLDTDPARRATCPIGSSATLIRVSGALVS